MNPLLTRAQTNVAISLAKFTHDTFDKFLEQFGVPLYDNDLNVTEEASEILRCALVIPDDPEDLPARLVEIECNRLLAALRIDSVPAEAVVVDQTKPTIGFNPKAPVPPAELEGCVMALVEKGRGNECWKWLGAGGRGKGCTAYFAWQGVQYHARRAVLWFSMRYYTAESPLRWSCRNQSCVNPEHWVRAQVIQKEGSNHE